MIFRLTQKVLKEFAKTPPALVERPEGAFFTDWYVNFFLFDRKKHLIFTEAASLFSFVVPGVSRQEIQALAGRFRKELARALFDEHFTAAEMTIVLERIGEMEFGKTINRSVLGSMNELILGYTSLKAGETTLVLDEPGLQREMRRSILNALITKTNLDYPIERFRRNFGFPVERTPHKGE